MSFSPHECIRHILVETEYIVSHCRGVTFDEFVGDETLRRAVVRSLEIIGEPAKKLPEDFRAFHPQIEWKAMSGLRDRLIHGYFGVDYELVWEIKESRIPLLGQQIRTIL